MSDTAQIHVRPRIANSILLRIVAILLVIVPAIALGYLGRSMLFVRLIYVLAIIGAARANRREMESGPHFRLLAVIVVIFMLRYSVSPPVFLSSRRMLNTPLFHVVAQCLLVLQVVSLFVRRIPPGESNSAQHDAPRFDAILPWFGAVALICAADLRVDNLERWTFQSLVLLYTLLYALFTTLSRPFVVTRLRQSRDSRALWQGFCLLITALIGWFSAALLYQHERDLDVLISRFIEPTDLQRRVGFSADGRLGSVSNRRHSSDDSVALRVFSNVPPGYLRGAVFESFAQHNWHKDERKFRLTYSKSLPNITELQDLANANDGRVFPFPLYASPENSSAEDPPHPKLERMECWPGTNPGADVFAPLGTRWLQLDIGSQLRIAADGQVASDDITPGLPWNVYHSPASLQSKIMGQLAPNLATDANDTQPALLAMMGSDVLDPIASDVFVGAVTTVEKIAAVEQFFANNFKYQKGLRVPQGVNSVDWFLTTRPPAHCEYFATAAVALLRRADVPARYVTGFLVSERNPYGGYWLARNRHAHAWAEAWDSETGHWRTVEATPAAGLPSNQTISRTRQLYEYLQGRMIAFRVKLQSGGLVWIGSSLWSFLLQPWLLTIVGLSGAAFLLVRWLKKKPLQVSRRTTDPTIRSLNRLLTKMDKRLRKHNLQRDPAETLHQFANRIEQGEQTELQTAADWYRDYATNRYTTGISADDIQRLRKNLAGI